MKKFRTKLFFCSTIFVLVFSLFGTVTVFAQDGNPPPPVAEEPVQPPAEDADSTQEAVSTDAPVETESAPTSTEEVASVEQVLEQLPANTTFVVLDESGESIPLATQEAADLVISGDPMWCPSGVLPGGAGCTSAHASFSSLITDLQTNSAYSGSGTIYISYDYDAAVTADAGSTIEFANNTLYLTDLVVQGGWNFSNNTNVGTSDLTGIDRLRFINWGAGNSLTLNDIVLNDAQPFMMMDAGLHVSAAGDVELNNVSVTDSTNDGAYIYTSAGNLVINDGDFSGNQMYGLMASSGNGDIILNNITANDNGFMGAYPNAAGSITMTGTNTFNGNGQTGLYVSSGGDATLNNITANDNKTGIFLGSNSTSNSKVINCAAIKNNQGYGLSSTTEGTLTLNGVIFDSNASGDLDPNGNDAPVMNDNDNCNPAPDSNGEGSTDSETQSKLYSIISQTPDQLPATLSDGNVFVSALQLVFTGDNAPETITLSFPIPDGMESAVLAVMYWNGSEWVEVPDGNVIDGKFVITVTAPGYYVLVSK